MSFDSMSIIISLFITGYGAYCIYSAFQMKYTGFPTNAMVSKNAVETIKDLSGFCKAIFKPFLIFSIILLIDGIISLINLFFAYNFTIDMACIVVMVLNVAWYVVFQVRTQKKFHA